MEPRGKRLWIFLMTLNLALLLHLLVYAVGDFPGFDIVSRLKLWTGLFAAVVFSALAWRGYRRGDVHLRSEALRTPLVVGAVTFLLLLALLPVPPSTYPWLAHAHTLLTFTVTLMLSYNLLFDAAASLRQPRLWLLITALAAVAISLIRLYGLSVYPFVDIQDEPWVTAWTLNFTRTGHFGDPTLAGLGDAYYAYPRFYVLLSLWLRVFGIGLWQGRLFGFLLIFPIIAFSAMAARNWYGRPAAVFTAAAMFASAVLMSAARIRHDVGLTVCVAVSLWLHTAALKRQSPLWHLFAGLMIGWGMFSHYHAAGFGIAMLVGLYGPGYAAQLRTAKTWRERLPPRGLLCYGLGGLLGGICVLFIQMMPDNLSGWLWALRQESKYSQDTGEFWFAFLGNFLNIGFFSIFELFLVAGAVLAAVHRRGRHDVALLIVMLLAHFLLAIMASGAIYYYILPLTPIYGILAGTILVRKTASSQSVHVFRRSEMVTFALMLMPLLGATTTRPLQAVLNGEPLNPVMPPAAQWVIDHASPNAVVAADMYYYFWLNDYRFASHLVPDFLYPENLERFSNPESIWAAVNMDVLIVDPSLTRSYRKYFQPLLAADLIDQNYVIAAQFPSGGSTVTVYQRRPSLASN
jgi:4-amino-4-deoxy-L-arabinose transferase-like glycosyltransferase